LREHELIKDPLEVALWLLGTQVLRHPSLLVQHTISRTDIRAIIDKVDHLPALWFLLYLELVDSNLARRRPAEDLGAQARHVFFNRFYRPKKASLIAE
jgi:hypothetical protein